MALPVAREIHVLAALQSQSRYPVSLMAEVTYARASTVSKVSPRRGLPASYPVRPCQQLSSSRRWSRSEPRQSSLRIS